MNANKKNIKGRNGRRGNRKPNTAGNRREDSTMEEDNDKRFSNNPAWYFTDQTVMEQAAQLAFQQIKGLSDIKGSYPVNIVTRYIVSTPQSMALINGERAKYRGINMAAIKFYNQLAATTGRALTYAPQDITMMMLGFGDLISLVEFIRRTFAINFLTNERNRAYPQQVITACGIAAQDLAANFANYRLRFNTLLTRINQLPIPKAYAYFDKCASLYENFYLDKVSPNAQTIIEVPAILHTLDETTYQSGTALITTPIVVEETALGDTGFSYNPTTKTMAEILDILEDMIDALVTSSTLNLVYADILNMAAKASVEFWRFDFFDDNYRILPVVQDRIHDIQFHNSRLLGNIYGIEGTLSGAVMNTAKLDIISDPDNNSIIFNPSVLKNSSHPLPKFGILDMDTPYPSVEERVDMTRYSVVFSDVAAYAGADTISATYVSNIAMGDHTVAFYTVTNDNGLSDTIPYDTYTSTVTAGSIAAIEAVAQVNSAPLLLQVSNDSGETDAIQRIIGEVDTTTTFDRGWFTRVNDIAALGLFTLRI